MSTMSPERRAALLSLTEAGPAILARERSEAEVEAPRPEAPDRAEFGGHTHRHPETGRYAPVANAPPPRSGEGTSQMTEARRRELLRHTEGGPEILRREDEARRAGRKPPK